MTILKVDPGEYWPSRAVSYPPASGPTATASTSPVATSTATSALGLVVPATALSAASCTRASSVVCTGWPATGATDHSVVAAVVPVSSVCSRSTRIPAVPASCASYCSDSPDRPVVSVAATRPFEPATSSWVAGPTVPSRERANDRVGANGSWSSCRTTPGSARSWVRSGT